MALGGIMYRRLRSLRENKKMTQKQIAEYLHMSQTGYNQYEIGRNDIPTNILIKLAKFYEVPVDYILEITDNSTPYERVKKD